MSIPEKFRRYNSALEKLVALTDRRGPDECWPWMGPKFHGAKRRHVSRGWKPSAYGITRVGREQFYAHRLTYAEFVGPIPDGYTIDHKCFNGLCQNPAHLEAVTSAENSRRYMTLKLWPGRQVKRGPEPVYYGEIRRLAASGLSQRAIAAEVGVAPATVFNAIHRRFGAAL